MLKGILAGGFWGVVLGGATLTVASLATEQPAGNTPPMSPQVTAPQTAVQSDDDVALQVPESDPEQGASVTGIDVAPSVVTPQIEASPTLADTSSAALPETAVVADDLVAPDETQTPVVDAATEEPVLPNPQSVAPQVPVAEQDIQVSTVPAALPEPVVVEEDVNETPTVALDIPVPMPKQVEVVVIEEPKAVPAAPPLDIAIPLPVPQVQAPQAASGLPAGSETVRVNRPEASDEDVTTEIETPVDPNAPALVRYATKFVPVDDKPLMSVILLDTGAMDGAVSAVSSLPFDVTVVIDPTLADASERLAAYRAKGIEVGVKSTLPAGATPADVEVTLEATFAALPETILLLDAGDGGLQESRAVTEQAMVGLSADGRGLVTVSKGLNMALRAADQADVPAGVIFRDLDSEGQDARVIRRFLDQAAFRARQESGVLLLGRMRADTISALVLWGTANRSGQVAFAPASAVLSSQ